ncbi:hypothetical protein HPB51_001951 [Rhipicephalus microplus]|uniref:Uncharacterized protein n=1 Tax=Rhipicephalus microplus TaxID=6941 RepID=A0A9J6DXW4_RHIMP|nr:hypothetical protein HPB51_001951 [Rhipicephalus microplus]
MQVPRMVVGWWCLQSSCVARRRRLRSASRALLRAALSSDDDLVAVPPTLWPALVEGTSIIVTSDVDAPYKPTDERQLSDDDAKERGSEKSSSCNSRRSLARCQAAAAAANNARKETREFKASVKKMKKVMEELQTAMAATQLTIKHQRGVIDQQRDAIRKLQEWGARNEANDNKTVTDADEEENRTPMNIAGNAFANTTTPKTYQFTAKAKDSHKIIYGCGGKRIARTTRRGTRKRKQKHPGR